MERALEESRSIAVFLDPDGLGPWEKSEMRAALQEHVRRECPVIPVFLPGVAEDIEEKLPLFLRANMWVVFRTDEYGAGIDSLVWGITGVKPEHNLATAQPRAKQTGQDALDDAIAKILRLLMSTNVTYFLGPGSCYGRRDSLPRSCDISRELLTELRLIGPGYDQLLPPVDIAGMYYAVGSGDTNLETKVVDSRQ
jgi:hypothetical protein